MHTSSSTNEFHALFGAGHLFIDPVGFRAWAAQAHTKASALAAPGVVESAMQAYMSRSLAPVVVGSVAVIDVCGPITYKSSWWSYYFGGAAIADLQQQFRLAVGNDAVKTIAFRVDSPGGVIDMVPEFANEIFQARSQKTVIAVADLAICSAAYWIASQAETIYATASAQLGALGVFTTHEDISGMLEKAGIKVTLVAHGEHKLDGNPYEPLPDDVRAAMKASVDEIGGWFDAAVARGRAVSVSDVLKNFGQGRVFRGATAIKLGLADKAQSFGQVLGRLTKSSGGPAAAVAASVASGRDAGRVLAQFKGSGALPILADSGVDEDEAPRVCPTCDEECPCEREEACPDDCETCAAECACVKTANEARAAIAREHAAILAALEADAI